jgi:hypothetical protein
VPTAGDLLKFNFCERPRGRVYLFMWGNIMKTNLTLRSLVKGGTALATSAHTGPALLEWATAWAQTVPWKPENGAQLSLLRWKYFVREEDDGDDGFVAVRGHATRATSGTLRILRADRGQLFRCCSNGAPVSCCKKFLLAAALATNALTAGEVWAQQNSTPPDFSGIWGHPYGPSFEPPAFGPGPVTNRSRLRGGPQAGVSNPSQLAGDYTNAILKPWAADVLKKRGADEINGLLSPNPYNQCWPQGVPFIFFNFGMQILQQPNKITFLYFSDPFRQVQINQQHPAHVTPSRHGNSVGHYEGDTLVIDTVGIKADRPFAMVDAYGTPHTGALLCM